MNEDCKRWIAIEDACALGGLRSADDDSFQDEHERTCVGCAREAAFWRTLETSQVDVDTAPTDVVERMVQTIGPPGGRETARGPVLSARGPRDREEEPRRRRLGWVPVGFPSGTAARGASVVAVCALAASIILVTRGRAPSPGGPATSSRIVIASGNFEVDGKPAETGTVLATGAVLRTNDRAACLSIEPGVRTCLAAGSEVLLVDAHLASRRLELAKGRLVAQLEPQPTGSRFVIGTRFGDAAAVGTMFTVEVPDPATERTTWVRVAEGIVTVTTPAGRAHRLEAHSGLRIADDGSQPIESEQERCDIAVIVGGLPCSAKPAVGSAPADSGTTSGEKPATAPPEPPLSASAMLARARRLLGEGRSHEAAATYRELISKHSASAEASAALVSLGKLELGPLGQPSRALHSFDAYLARGGGALTEEATCGKIDALHALGRVVEERPLVEEFLRRFPSSVHAARLAARLGVSRPTHEK